MRNVNVCCCDDAIVGGLERRIDELDNSLDTVASSWNWKAVDTNVRPAVVQLNVISMHFGFLYCLLL